MISVYVKEARLAKGYTQKELSDLSNISVRSIQRIENAEIVPRSYTLKTLSEVLGISFESLQETETVSRRFVTNKSQKLILSVGLCLALIFLAQAFIAQSARFPETNFELFVFWALVLTLITAILFLIWRTRS